MMVSRVLAVVAVCLVPCLAEPPSSYLPPNNFQSFGEPPEPTFSLSAPAAFSSGGYSTISKTYGAPKPVYSAPKPVYSPPKPVYSAPKPVYSAPAPSYSAPKPTYLPPSKPVYGPPEHHHHHEEYHSAPAHYEYQYTVHDSHYGTDFGHKEDRQGDVTHGQYMVLLPDGRRQIVDYVADKHGYRPTIRYEGVANVKQGY